MCVFRGRLVLFIHTLYSFRSNIQPGKSIQVQVTTALYANVPIGTTIVVEFIVQSYWASQPAASRAAYLYVGVQSVSFSLTNITIF